MNYYGNIDSIIRIKKVPLYRLFYFLQPAQNFSGKIKLKTVTVAYNFLA